MVAAYGRVRARITGPYVTYPALFILIAAIVYLLLPRVIEAGFGFFLQILLLGVANGGIYALIALGYTMVYGIIELINFAHGDVFTLGAFVSLPIMGAFGLTEGKSGGIGLVIGLILV